MQNVVVGHESAELDAAFASPVGVAASHDAASVGVEEDTKLPAVSMAAHIAVEAHATPAAAPNDPGVTAVQLAVGFDDTNNS
jgi:hypothetical protein